MDVKATTRCENCGAEFADHLYEPDSITKYRCPHPQITAHYGYYRGGDPNDFSPDLESCSEAEIQAWQRACKDPQKFLREHRPHVFESNPTFTCVCSLRPPFGIGICTEKHDTYFEPCEERDGQRDEHRVV